MRERPTGPESFKAPTPSSERIARVLKWATPDSHIRRLSLFRSARSEAILKYPHTPGTSQLKERKSPQENHTDILIAADYQSFSPAFGLRVMGQDRIYRSAADIESLFARYGQEDWRGKTEAQQVEALMLHGILSHSEAHRDLPNRNARKIEKAIFGAHLSNAQTTAELEGRERIYFPFVEQYSEPHGAKMIQVITGRTAEDRKRKNLTEAEVRALRSVVNNSAVEQVLHSIPDHAVTIQEKLYGGVGYIEITDAKGKRRLVNKSLSEEVPAEWITYNGAEFVAITDKEGKRHVVHELLSEEVTAEILKGRRLMLVLGAGGDNARRFAEGWDAQKENLLIAAVGGRNKVTQIGNKDKDGYQIDIFPELQFQSGTEKDPKDDPRIDALLASGLVSYVYDSTPVDFRLQNLMRALPHMLSGKVERYVTTKPVAKTLSQYRELRGLLKQLDVTGQPVEKRFFIHEHYLAKGPMTTFLKYAEQVIETFGMPVSIEASLQEKITAEEQKREKAVNGGMIEDLFPHLASIALALARKTHNSGRYKLFELLTPLDYEPSLLEKVRYEPSKLGTTESGEVDKSVETGFVVKGQATIQDTVKGRQRSLEYTLKGGKGSIEKKEVRMRFIHPETGKQSEVVIDLINNRVILPENAPEALQALFRGISHDNGYRGLTASAITNDDPEATFQRLGDAYLVKRLEDTVRNSAADILPIQYSVNEPRRDVEEIAVQGRRRRAA